MPREATVQKLIDGGIIAVVRADSGEQLAAVAEALAEGGVPGVEITFTVPDADLVLRDVRRKLGDRIVLGAGTVLDPETARIAILAGADFLVGPTLNPDVIRLAHRYDRAVMPGAYTPTEILHAWESGADIVKVFPAEVGGPAFFKAVRGPLPQVRLMPTGGVDESTAAAFLKAGACCLGVGSALVDPKLVAAGDLAAIRRRAERFAGLVREARAAP